MQPITSTTTQVTSNYEQFRLMDTNRAVNRAHVEAIKESFETNGNFTQAQPVLVNENFEVIDGQHRVIACQELNQPVHYTMIPGLRINEARNMNILHKQWRGIDYLESYANEGRQAYIDLLALHEEYPDVALSVLNIYVLGTQTHGYNKAFRTGELQQFDMEQARERLDRLTELVDVTPIYKTKAMSLALLKCMRSDRYDQSRMVRKSNQLAADIRSFQNIEDNVRQLEDVYNHKLIEANRVRFF